MFTKIWRFLTLLFTALSLGTSFAHTLEMPAKLRYDGQLYVTLQNSLYLAWGPPYPGVYLEPGALIGMATLAFLVRKQRRTFALTLVALGCMFLAFPVVYFFFVEPVNATFRQARPVSVPDNWRQLREQWEYGHTTRFVLHLLAFSALVFSLLTEQPSQVTADATVITTEGVHERVASAR